MKPMLSLRSIGLVLAVLVPLSAPMIPPAAADADAEAFTQRLIDDSVKILSNADDATRLAKFRAFIGKYADASKAASFTLGIHRRSASDADVAAFTVAFKNYVSAVYEKRLAELTGQTLKVVGSIDNKPGDVTVNTVLVDPGAEEPLRVSFRLEGGGGNYHFVDIQVAGIWLSIDQRDQFAAFLSRNGGNVPALTADLTARAQQISADIASSPKN